MRRGALLREAWVAGEAPGAVDEHAGADPSVSESETRIDLAVLRRHRLRAALDDARVGVAAQPRDGGVVRVSSEVLHCAAVHYGRGDPVGAAMRDVDGGGNAKAARPRTKAVARDAAEVAARLGTDVDSLPAAAN